MSIFKSLTIYIFPRYSCYSFTNYYMLHQSINSIFFFFIALLCASLNHHNILSLWYMAYLITALGHGAGETALTVASWRRYRWRNWRLWWNFRRQWWPQISQIDTLKMTSYYNKCLIIYHSFSSSILTFRKWFCLFGWRWNMSSHVKQNKFFTHCSHFMTCPIIPQSSHFNPTSAGFACMTSLTLTFNNGGEALLYCWCEKSMTS